VFLDGWMGAKALLRIAYSNKKVPFFNALPSSKRDHVVLVVGL
jgi:hypothetical protein